ncbi:MAG: DUF4124 domain-containing protein [Proteobacteria bacterium]|nr:DUF4124 domain-containing protein [Pseudomonadota bacterium]
MNGKALAIACALAALTVSAGTAASEIYKWIDEDGNVHYEDRPSGASSVERLDIPSRRTDDGSVRQRIDAFRETRAARAEASSAAAAAQKAAEENAAAEAERRQACERARARLESYLQARRLYRMDDNGERIYLDDAQRQAARTRAEEAIAEHCS